MPRPSAAVAVRHLDQCLVNAASITQVRQIVDKVDKICKAIDQKMNLADLFADPANVTALIKTFGREHFEAGLQLLSRLALESYETRSFSTHSEISSQRKKDFLFRSMGGWKQFDIVLVIQVPGAHEPSIFLINPAKQAQWRGVESIPAGAMVTVHVKTAQGKRVRAQEAVAAERCEQILDVVQLQSDRDDAAPAPVVQLQLPEEQPGPARGPVSNGKAHANGYSNGHGRTPARPTAGPRKLAKPSFSAHAAISTSGPPVLGFRVVVNKMDTFVHAGNAQLILGHIRDYAGRVMMYVLRAEKKNVRLDADSIWSAEIRNGETVLFEFFGPQPSEQFVKELAKKVNKYTQMDKMGGE